MWFNTNTQAVYRSHAEIRAAFANTSFPSDLHDSVLLDFGVCALLPSPIPEHDPTFQIVEEGQPLRIDGLWTQQWDVRDKTAEELDQVRQQLHEQRRNARTSAEMAGFLFQDKRIDSDRDSILRITQAALLASQSIEAEQPFGVEWVCADDSVLELDAAGMLAMQQAMTFHGLACHNRSQALRTLIDGATDGQSLSLAAADLVTGWPA